MVGSPTLGRVAWKWPAVAVLVTAVAGFVCSPAEAQSQSKACVQATAAYSAAVTKRNDAVAQGERAKEGARLFVSELGALDAQMTALGAGGGAPGVTQAALLMRREQLQKQIRDVEKYYNELGELSFKLQDEIEAARRTRDEACKPTGFWERLKSLVSSSTGGDKLTAVRYPRPVHVYHVDRYFEPDTPTRPGGWTNTLIGFETGVWMLSEDRIPDADGLVDARIVAIAGNNLRRAHVDKHLVFNTNAELCPKLRELKLRLDKDEMRKYRCE